MAGWINRTFLYTFKGGVEKEYFGTRKDFMKRVRVANGTYTAHLKKGEYFTIPAQKKNGLVHRDELKVIEIIGA